MRRPPLEINRLVEELPEPAADEAVQVIWQTPNMRVERIVSYGHASEDGVWYDQSDDEWVMVLTGEGVLEIDGDPQQRTLGPGAAISLPAHTRHRVVSTAADEPTVWLAIHTAVKQV
ncbi:MAG: cupin domain-containing protein [Pseudomonadota bacterium]